MVVVRATILIGITALLIACGGGGGGGDSPSPAPPATVNAAPVANAGPAQNVTTGTAVTLNGGASSDADRNPLTYSWTLSSRPVGSAAALVNATSAAPTFVADVAGSYVANLVVNDGLVSSPTATVTVTATLSNAAPVANAGPAQSVTSGSMVTLNGSASTDANGDPLTYAWTFASRPAGSGAVLAGAASAAPVFTADVAGIYVASLIVNDGTAGSAPATVTITVSAANAAPVAAAGPLQSVATGTTVTLNGSGSSDANGDPLTFAWTLTSRPAGSTAALTGATSAAPTFLADLVGTYVATLVVSDGSLSSAAATVTVTATTANAAPVANAGPPQSVTTATTVTLDGSASSDANGDPLSYGWTLTSRPMSSAAVLAGANSVAPTFTADLAGTYVATLVVNDGRLSSPAVAVTITVSAGATNAAPVASAGPSQNVTTGSTVTLNGSASSDANGDPLTYSWTLTARPAGSGAVLASSSTVSPTFVADLAGTYVARLVVNDGTVASAPATVTILAAAGNVAPVANAGPSQNVITGTTVTLNGGASSDANGDSLTYLWTFASLPAGSTLSPTSSSTAVTATFVPDVSGVYVLRLVVNDGRLNSAPVTVTVSASVPVASPGVTLWLFSSELVPQYLGCLNCSSFDAESVCNRFGTYGSSFQLNSIWNQFGTYGSQFGLSSPWNRFSTSGPQIIGSDGLSYGFFTINSFQFNRTRVASFVNVLNYFSSTGNLAATRTYACGN